MNSSNPSEFITSGIRASISVAMAEETHLTQAVKAQEERIEAIMQEGAQTRNAVSAMNLEMQTLNARVTDFMVSFKRLAAELKETQSLEVDGGSQEEFNKLQQTGSVNEYHNRYEVLRAAVFASNTHQPECYWISSFIN